MHRNSQRIKWQQRARETDDIPNDNGVCWIWTGILGFGRTRLSALARAFYIRVGSQFDDPLFR